MNGSLLNKKMPTLVGLFLLFAGIGAALFVVSNTTDLRGKASADDEPKNIRISNVSPNSLTISFVTDSDVLASVSYGQSSSDLTEVEAGSNSETSTHVITLLNLTPKTEYFFKIISGKSEYSDNGSPFATTTSSDLTGSPEIRSVKGVVLAEDGTPAAGALVYLTTGNANVISTQTETDGSFDINASQLLTADLTSFYTIDENTKLLLTALNNKAELTATFLTFQGDPLPPVTLGQTYNFTLTGTDQEATSSAEISPQKVEFPIFKAGATEDRVVNIETPEANEEFSDQQPEFQGTALPNEKVEITIQSAHEIVTSVNSDTKGNWEYRPETPLEPGNHTITIKTRDENGILRILTRPFTVYAQGSQFTEPSVSPSAPTVTPTKISPLPTAIPTVAVEEPTPTPTVIPTQTPVPSIITPTPIPQVDPTGPTNIPLVIVSSVVILISGIFFYFLTKINSV